MPLVTLVNLAGVMNYLLCAFECGSRKSKEDHSAYVCAGGALRSQIHFPVTTCNNLTPENLTKTGFHNKIVYIKKSF